LNRNEALLRKVVKWTAGPNTGLSSEAMAYCAVDITRDDHWADFGPNIPHDPTDFNRCLLLVDQIPEIRDHFPKIAAMAPEWKKVIDNWDRVKECFIAEVGWNWSEGKEAPKTYAMMKEIQSN
jgi:hypothetical protein